MAGTNIQLKSSTGVARIDRILQATIASFETEFPNRVRVYYLSGSYADNTAAGPLSDIDLMIVFRGAFLDEQEEARARAHTRAYGFVESRPADHRQSDERLADTVRVDAFATYERQIPQLHPVHQVGLKRGCLLLYGEDIRAQLKMPPLDAYTRGVTGGAIAFISKILRDIDVLHLPLDYPDANRPFFGYVGKHIPSWYPPTSTGGTKEIVATVSRISTAIIAIQAKSYVSGKAESIRLYQSLINDEWAAYVETLHRRLKHDWHYQVPSGSRDRDELQTLCEQTLNFENHFLTLYRTYLLDLVDGDDPEARSFATQQLEKLTP